MKLMMNATPSQLGEMLLDNVASLAGLKGSFWDHHPIKTDHNGGVYVLGKNEKPLLISNNGRLAAMVDSGNALVFGAAIKIGPSPMEELAQAAVDYILADEKRKTVREVFKSEYVRNLVPCALSVCREGTPQCSNCRAVAMSETEDLHKEKLATANKAGAAKRRLQSMVMKK